MNRFMRFEARRKALGRTSRATRWASGTTLALALVLAAEPAARGEAPEPGPTIVDEPLTQYRALRRMHARSEKFGHEGWLDAWTELDGNRFTFEIVSERGSEYVRKKVLREILERERDLIANGQQSRGDLTPTNYEFVEPEDAPAGERHVLLKPRRKDVMLVHGRMVLTPDGRDLLRVEGRLAKNPSFWTSLVNVIRRYARLGGVRVPVSVETTAKVKIAGTSHLRVDYEYESINGRPVIGGEYAFNRSSTAPGGR